MNETSDAELLRKYAYDGSEAAFRELVTRHTDFVFSAAVRQVDSPDLACDITQRVFTDLASKARLLAEKIPATSSAAGWLHRSTRYAALNHQRATRRRRANERLAMDQLLHDPEPGHDWERIRPVLDEALDSLGGADREALLLRYFKNQDFRAVGRALGVSDDAAQKRVSRAVERLREFFAKRGVTIGASSLAVIVSTHAVQAAPAGLAVTISTGVAPAVPSLAATVAATVIKTIAMTTTQKILLTLALLLFLSGGTYQAYRANTRRRDLVPAGATSRTSLVLPSNGAKQTKPVGARFNRNGPSLTPRLVKLAADLRTALYNIPSSKLGTRSYPPENVMRALLAFGPDRKEAFATLEEAMGGPDPEIRLRALSAMGYVGMAATPQLAQFGLAGDPAPEAKPFLWTILLANDPELTPIALSSLRTIGFEAKEIPALTDLMTHTTDQQLLRYLPEAIAKTIQSDPAGARPLMSAIESLLDHAEPGNRFEAACALAKQESAGNPKILATLVSGLKGTSNLQQLMALETLQSIGPAAEAALPAILDFTEATTDSLMKDIAFKTMGQIKSELRSGLPEVEKALKHEESIAAWNEKFTSGNYSRQDLLDALKEPMFSSTAAQKLGELGSQAKDTIPNLMSALAGQDQSARERIVESIHQIDPQATIAKVEFKTIASASMAALMTLEGRDEQRPRTPLAQVLEKSMMGNSEWQTQQELVTLAEVIAGQDHQAYRAFAGKLIELEPNLAKLIPEPAQ